MVPVMLENILVSVTGLERWVAAAVTKVLVFLWGVLVQ